jgi:ATP-dependent DNA helicase RecG
MNVLPVHPPERLQKAGFSSWWSILTHFPKHYKDCTSVTPLRALKIGTWVVVSGMVEKTYEKPFRIKISDATGCLYGVFFHDTPRIRSYAKAQQCTWCGVVQQGPYGWYITHPKPTTLKRYLTPTYPVIPGIAERVFQQTLQQAFTWLKAQSVVSLPTPMQTIFNLHPALTLSQALYRLHYLPPHVSWAQRTMPEQRYLIAEEWLYNRHKLHALQTGTAPVLSETETAVKRAIDALPFALTTSQQEAVTAIMHDMAQSSPMMRLVQGDVGSGKTVVAGLAAVMAMHHHWQVALMVPTTLLARQHGQTLQAWLEPLGYHIDVLTSASTQRLQKKNKLADGTLQCVIGTQALLSKTVDFHRLGLIMIDEQHRFGVSQRMQLIHKCVQPHRLMLTATPIPRTLTMTLLKTLAISIIIKRSQQHEVTTILWHRSRLQQVLKRVDHLLAMGQQVYWVCPWIDTVSEVSVQDVTAYLKKECPHWRIGTLHGNVQTKEQTHVMERFITQDFNVLIATTMIEVGIDIPNVTLMVIERPSAFGLAQLHQLRGRVGRGAIPGYCILLCDDHDWQDPERQDKLTLFKNTTDGHKIAEMDHRLRGPGNVLGAEQSGVMALKYTNSYDYLTIADKLEKALPYGNAVLFEALAERWQL